MHRRTAHPSFPTPAFCPAETVCGIARFRNVRAVVLTSLSALALVLAFPTRTAATQPRSAPGISIRLGDSASSGSELRISVVNGTVTLRGSVNALEDHRRILELVRSVRNVQHIVDRLEVSPPRRPDDDILRDVTHALEAEPTVADETVQVAVTKGTVTLRGMVHEWQQRDLVGWIAGKVRGVRAVENKLGIPKMIRPDGELLRDLAGDLEVELAAVRMPPWNAGTSLSSSFDRPLNVAPPDVAVNDGVVTLSGTVPSLLVKETATQIAESETGVTDVVDQTTVAVDPHVTDPDVLRNVRFVLSNRAKDLQLTSD